MAKYKAAAWCHFVLAPVFLVALSCGSHTSSHRSPGAPPADKDEATADAGPAGSGEVLRGHWEIPVASGGEGRTSPNTLFLKDEPSATQTISATVEASIKFVVGNSNFKAPVASGLASYGSLDVTELRDNNLKVCGSGGKDLCTQGIIRIYTKDTPGSGLWNSVDGYGLPITSNANAVGLNASGAFAAATATVGAKKVLQLSDFTAAASLKIPVSVDFTNAGAGSFASTLVVEYVLH